MLNPAAVGAVSDPLQVRWTHRDAIIYALGVGAGASVDELAFTTENSIGVPQRTLPTFGLVLGDYGAEAMKAVGDVDQASVVHGGQSIRLHTPIPAEGSLTSTTSIAAIWDKATAAVVVLETNALDDATGKPLFTSTSQAFVRGAGGWGGDRGPKSPPDLPSRDPDVTLRFQTTARQALLYRMSGDRNPLHSDPTFAARAGFELPILHGLCTLGIASRQIMAFVGGDVDRFASVSCRFSAPVLPGDELATDVWLTDSGAAFTVRRGAGEVALTAGAIELSLRSDSLDQTERP